MNEYGAFLKIHNLNEVFFIDTYNELREKLIEKNKAKSIRENVNLILRDSKEFLTSQTA